MRFEYVPTPEWPPLAWVACVGDETVEVDCGTSVRCADGGFFEGTWAGDGDLASPAVATTVFGSGIVATDDGLLLVTPSHQLESVYLARADGRLIASNSLVGLLRGAGLALDPDADYPTIFLRTTAGIAATPLAIPTLGESVAAHFFDNLRLSADGSVVVQPKPREPAFTSFGDYCTRLSAALASLFANAAGHEPVLALSAGYDSTALAALAAPLGCRRAIGFRTAKLMGNAAEVADSGAATARRLGLAFSLRDRLAYLERSDLPEAEFLASGMSGEDVVFSAFEAQLRGAMLLTGSWPAWVWAARGPRRTLLERDDLSAASLTEFRLRNDTFAVHPAFFGATEQPSLLAIAGSPEMAPFRVGGDYDRPIPRRIAEEAGLPRGSFATHKRAVSHNLNRHGAAAFAPATLRSIEAFVAADGRGARIRSTRRVGRLHRAAARALRLIGAEGPAGALDARRLARMHFEPRIGTLLLRWAVSVVEARYQAARRPLHRAP